MLEQESQNGCCLSNSPLAPGRPINGGTSIPCAKPSLPCVTVDWAGYTSLGGPKSMLFRIVFGIDEVDR